MTQALRVSEESETDVSTILSARVLIPINCDRCNKETDISIQTLKEGGTIMCEHCYDVRPFSAIEQQTLRAVLAQIGFHFAG
jgi:transcription elongation factor Elf1